MNKLAWLIVRIIGLAQFTIGMVVSYFYHPNPCRAEEFDAFNFLHNSILSGWMLFNASSPEDVPKIVADKVLQVGYFLLYISIFVLFAKIWWWLV